MDFIAHTRMRAGIENMKFHCHKPKPSSGSRIEIQCIFHSCICLMYAIKHDELRNFIMYRSFLMMWWCHGVVV